MKLPLFHSNERIMIAPRNTAGTRGSAVLVLLALIVLMSMLCAATTRSVASSQQEIALIEKQQIARLAAVSANTNTLSVARSMSAP